MFRTVRTPQICVHMAHIAHPLLGDQTYGGRPRPPKTQVKPSLEVLRAILKRQCLACGYVALSSPDYR